MRQCRKGVTCSTALNACSSREAEKQEYFPGIGWGNPSGQTIPMRRAPPERRRKLICIAQLPDAGTLFTNAPRLPIVTEKTNRDHSRGDPFGQNRMAHAHCFNPRPAITHGATVDCRLRIGSSCGFNPRPAITHGATHIAATAWAARDVSIRAPRSLTGRPSVSSRRICTCHVSIRAPRSLTGRPQIVQTPRTARPQCFNPRPAITHGAT